jgi:hypothetical protein
MESKDMDMKEYADAKNAKETKGGGRPGISPLIECMPT